jgi:hypothetical protein
LIDRPNLFLATISDCVLLLRLAASEGSRSMATYATLLGTHETTCHDTLVPDPQVQKEFGITAMSIWRWDRDPELIKLGWPPPIRIRSRKFRSRIALENFKSVMARRAIEQRARAV